MREDCWQRDTFLIEDSIEPRGTEHFRSTFSEQQAVVKTITDALEQPEVLPELKEFNNLYSNAVNCSNCLDTTFPQKTLKKKLL